LKRIMLSFVPGVRVAFADRDAGLWRLREWAERGTVNVKVVFGPEGCGKTALLKQAVEVFRGYGYEVIYVDPLHGEYLAYTSLRDVARRLAEIVSEAVPYARLAMAVLELAQRLVRAGRRRVAVLVDDVFQAVGLERATAYVKSMLNLVEYPPGEPEKVVAIAATSEGVSRREIGRHRWAEMLPLWNMSREGFRLLYEQLPAVRVDFEVAWRLTGGNPKMLAELYMASWNSRAIISRIVRDKRLVELLATLDDSEQELLWKAVEDPDVLVSGRAVGLLDRLVELNLIVDGIYPRDPQLWLDTPPPERDPGLGIGRYAAWQTPLHREAVREALEQVERLP